MALNAKTPSYLQPTASTTQRAASSAPSKASKRSRHPTTTKHVPPQSHAPLPHSKDAPSTSGDVSSSKGELKSSVPKSRVTGAPVGQPSHSPPAEGHTVQPEPHHDTLQVAAQVQSWLFMQSNLQDSLSMVQKGVQDTHNVLAEAIPNDICGTSRSDVEGLIAFLDDLSNAGSETGLTLFVDQFLEHERSWLKLQSELTQFIARLSQAPTASPLEEGQNIKARLSEEASRIESLVTNAEVWRNEPDRIHHMLSQLYPLLRARFDNASMASDVIDCSLGNILAMRRLRE